MRPWCSNFIDQLLPELSAFARSLEQALGGTVQANLYLSSKRKQGFKAHFDFHDVFAMHVMGEKTWSVFQGRADNPIKHPMFEGWPRERHDQLQGELWREVRLRPGDLLYLPRGQYHYALADDGPCVHIAWGVTYPIGMDVVSYAFERMVAEALGRANLPRDRVALQSRLAEIGAARGTEACRAAGARGHASDLRQLPRPRDRYDLPGLIERAEAAFRVKRAGLRLVSQGGRHGLVKEGTRQAVEVPAAIQPQVAWVLGRDRFAQAGARRQHSRPRASRSSTVCSATSTGWRWSSPPEGVHDCGKSATTSVGMPDGRTTMIAMGG